MNIQNMDKQNKKSVHEDLANLARVLPHVWAPTLYNELNELIDDEERVLKILRKHLTSYNVQDNNDLSIDIKIIKRVLPDYPIIQISNELFQFNHDKTHRVQLVLKKYFQNETSNFNLQTMKRDSSELQFPVEISEKKMKLEEPTEKNLNDNTLNVPDFNELLNELEILTGREQHQNVVENDVDTKKATENLSENFSENLNDGTEEVTVADIMENIPNVSIVNEHLHKVNSEIDKVRKQIIDDISLPNTSKHYPIVMPKSVIELKNSESEESEDSNDVIVVSVNGEKPKPLEFPTEEEGACCLPQTVSGSGVHNLNMENKKNVDDNSEHPKFYYILEMFPNICPMHLRDLCSKIKDENEIILRLLTGDYKMREQRFSPELQTDFNEQYKTLEELFPDADPTFLQSNLERLVDQPDELRDFVAQMIERKNYPTKTDYLKRMKLTAQEKQYTTEFSIKHFLEIFPNPDEYFMDPERKQIYVDIVDREYVMIYLKNRYTKIPIANITHVFRSKNYNIVETCDILDKLKVSLKSKRKPYPVSSCKNIPLLQALAYVNHKTSIINYRTEQEKLKMDAREEARKNGLMKTCQCCYDEEIMPDDIIICDNCHTFCKDCVKRSAEVLIGDGKLEFPCLNNCDTNFSLQILQSVLDPRVFSKLACRKQLEEVKAAGIEDLESCPFCDFATIPAPDDKIFRCMNNDCMKESCRLCHEPSHIPLRCDEVEKDENIKARTYIENKMSEALIRKCHQCGLKFIKENGCNKMTCSCGAMMCYECNQPVKDYSHFNGQGGDKFHLCPLFSDTVKLHRDAVIQSAENAKRELGIDGANSSTLKIDPTEDLQKHYKEMAAQAKQQNPNQAHINMVLNNQFHLHHHNHHH